MFTVGVFQDVAWAERGVAALLSDGFTADGVTILGRQSPEVAALILTHLGLAGEPLEVKGLGPAVGRGPLIAALQDSDRGLETSGLSATLGRAGFQSHDGQIFEALVGRGGVLVAVASVPRAADALAKLHSYGAGNAAIGAWAGRV